MYYYFASKKNCSIKINGVHFGFLSKETKYIKIEDENALIEISPLNECGNSLSFMLNSEFLYSPPKNISIVDLEGGFLVYIDSLVVNSGFSVYNQKHLDNFLVTIFCDNGNKISIQSQNDFFVQEINIDFKETIIEQLYLDGEPIIFVCFIGEKKYVYIYNVSNKTRKITNILVKDVFDFNIKNGLILEEHLHTIKKHIITTSFGIKDGNVYEKNKNISFSKTFNLDTVAEKVIPYLFLEDFFVSENFYIYFSDELYSSLGQLKEYLGNFIGIFPPPIFKNQNSIGLVYKNGKNKYHIKYVVFEISNRKICNLFFE